MSGWPHIGSKRWSEIRRVCSTVDGNQAVWKLSCAICGDVQYAEDRRAIGLKHCATCLGPHGSYADDGNDTYAALVGLLLGGWAMIEYAGRRGAVDVALCRCTRCGSLDDVPIEILMQRTGQGCRVCRARGLAGAAVEDRPRALAGKTISQPLPEVEAQDWCDLTGYLFGYWWVLGKETAPQGEQDIVWRALCVVCNRVRELDEDTIRAGLGCQRCRDELKRKRPFYPEEQITGGACAGNWQVLYQSRRSDPAMWWCRCLICRHEYELYESALRAGLEAISSGEAALEGCAGCLALTAPEQPRKEHQGERQEVLA